MERDFPQPVFYLPKWGKETRYMHVVIKIKLLSKNGGLPIYSWIHANIL